MHSDILKPILAATAALVLLFTFRHLLVGSRAPETPWAEPLPETAMETLEATPKQPPEALPSHPKPKPPSLARKIHQRNAGDDTPWANTRPQESGAKQTQQTSRTPDAALPDEFPIPSSVDDANRMLQSILDSDHGNPHRAIENLGKGIAQMARGRNQAVDAILEVVADDWLRRRFLDGYLYQLGHDDPSAAIAFAETVEDDLRINSTRSSPSVLYGKNNAISAAIKGWASANLEEARNWVEELENGAQRNYALTALAREWGMQDMGGALNWAESMMESGDARWLRQVAAHYALKDLEGALDYLSDIEPGVARDAYLQGIIARWAIQSPQEAMEATGTTSAASTAQNLARQVLGYWARKSPEEAMRWVENSASEASHAGNIQTVVRAWAQTAPDAALEYATSVADEKQRELLTRTAVTEMGRRQPARALEILDDLPESPQHDRLEERILAQWSKSDPISTASWVAEMDDVAKQHVATGNLMLQWGAKDIDAAVEWTRQLPSGATRNAAVLAIAAANQSFADRKDLTEWQRLIRDPELPAATVTELLHDSALPDDLRRTLQKAL